MSSHSWKYQQNNSPILKNILYIRILLKKIEDYSFYCVIWNKIVNISYMLFYITSIKRQLSHFLHKVQRVLFEIFFIHFEQGQ